MNELKQVKICLGRFQPFTLGHLKLATYNDLKGPDKEQVDSLRESPDLDEIKKQKTVILSILTTKEKVDARHPFDADLMKEEMEMIKKEYSKDIEDILYVNSADICAWGELLKSKGYCASVWLTGSDEYKVYKMMAMKVPEYEEKNRDNRDCKGAYTKSFYVEKITRNENSSDFTETISGTKVREALKNDDKELFKKMMPKGCDNLFDKFKEAITNAPEPKQKKSRKVKESKIIKYINNVNMKSLKEYIFEYKERITTGFNYEKIEQAIKNCKPKFFGNNVCLDILWTPQIYFTYDNGWSADKPNDAFHDGKHYTGISIGTSSVMFIDFFAEKNIFKKNTLEGYISWILPSKINDDDTNLDEIEKYLDSKSNHINDNDDVYPIQKNIKFTSYEELEKYLKEIEDIVNKHNIKCDKNEPTYLYFDKSEASLNAQFKKNQYEILSCEEKIVELNKKLEDIKKAEESTDTDLSELKTSIENQINILKKLKEKNK